MISVWQIIRNWSNHHCANYNSIMTGRVRGLDSPNWGPEIMTGNCDPWHRFWGPITTVNFPLLHTDSITKSEQGCNWPRLSHTRPRPLVTPHKMTTVCPCKTHGEIHFYIMFMMGLRDVIMRNIQNVPLASEPGISLIILTPMKILQRNLNSTCYDVTFLTQRTYSCSNFVAISSLVLELLTLRWLMSYIYGAPILDVSRSHTTTQHSR